MSFAVVLALFGVLACDNTFEPIAESDRAFSVFGHLDPSADTQWIRVMQTRPLIFTSPEPPGVIVTLEELGTGRSLLVRDSIFEYPHNVHVGSEGVFVHNFWTTDRIVPGEVYRFTASGPNGQSTVATVPVPADFSVTVALQQRSTSLGAPDEVRISGVEALAFVRVHALVRSLCSRGVQVLPYPIPEGSSDPHAVSVNKEAGFPERALCLPRVIERRDLWIVGSGSPWPNGQQFSSGALGVPELPTNLSNAIGFLGGVLTKLIPYEDCRIVGPEPLPEYCELRYDSEKAMLSGTIRDPCGNRPLVDAVIRLEELAASPGAHRKVRTAPSGLFGAYRIAALDPGVRYALEVSHPELVHPAFVGGKEGTRLYLDHTATLQFSAGEQATLDVRLQRVLPC